MADSEWKQQGQWAIDTANTSAWDAAREVVMTRSAVDDWNNDTLAPVNISIHRARCQYYPTLEQDWCVMSFFGVVHHGRA